MFNDNYSRRNKGKKPVVAICYDFDKTLTPNEMQAQGYIQSLGYKVSEFWNKSNGMAEDNDMDENLAYMYMMVKESIDHHKLDRKTLEEYGSEVNLFPGVEDWFKRIREYGAERGVIVEHYIISSGIKEMIEGTDIAKKGEFEKIYASSFYYNEEGLAEWPAQVVNYTNKTQFLFRIQKGTLDINDPGINDFFPPDEIRVPFRNIVYIGDSDTDIPCMKLVNTYGGYSIGVFDPKHKHSKDKVYKMIKDKRIKYFAPADYREDGKLDLIIKNIIERTVFNEKLESTYYTCIREAYEDEKKSPRD